jgi:hypothetical protein
LLLVWKIAIISFRQRISNSRSIEKLATFCNKNFYPMAAFPLGRHGMVMPDMPICREFSIPSGQGRFQGILQQKANRADHARPRGSTPPARPYLKFSTAGRKENRYIKIL